MIDPAWSMTIVFEKVLPTLREDGAFTDDTYEQVFVENAKAWLTA